MVSSRVCCTKNWGDYMDIVYECESGKIIHGDNLAVLDTISDNSVDSCISDFPYAIDFMGKCWDSYKTNFYTWCNDRANSLLRVLKPGGYVAIFGHPKTNHRMKCAFEDAGFRIVEEIDWVYLTGMPKNQDIKKLIDANPTDPDPVLSKLWDGWKTAGLKPAHEPITVFQKPLDGTYVENIEKYGCGGMNIDACRVAMSKDDHDMIDAKASKNPTVGYWCKDDHIYGDYAMSFASPSHKLGRFPMNMILSEDVCDLIDMQTGITKSTGGTGFASRSNRCKNTYGMFKATDEYINDSLGGYGDVGGGSRMFTVIKYCPKPSPSEKLLPDGSRNTHVTVKPVDLIKWLVMLLTPKSGTTIDITAGSCTHAVACEELNRNFGYDLTWIDVELMNSNTEPYCEIGKKRMSQSRQCKLF